MFNVYFTGEWSDENCRAPDNSTDNKDFFGLKKCDPFKNENPVDDNCTFLQTSSEQYWYNSVLKINLSGIGEPGDLGGFDYPLPLALLFSWLVVFLCLMKGVKSSGKVSDGKN